VQVTSPDGNVNLTTVLNLEIGKLAVFACRTGNTWFLGVVCGPEGRTIRVLLFFLGDGEYKSLLVRDNEENAAAVIVEESTARRSDTLTIEMINGGGFVGRFSKR
jgi:alpha-glucosidase